MPAHARTRGAAPPESPLIVCLDLQREQAPPAPNSARRIGACQRLLAHARKCSWPVIHLFRSQDRTFLRGDGEPGAPLEGLQPRPFESVLFRTGLSAFSDRKFSGLVVGKRRALVLLSASLGPACLATMLDAQDRGLSVTLVEDVLAAPAVRGVPRDTVHTVLLGVAGAFVQRTTSARMLRLMPAGELQGAANDF